MTEAQGDILIGIGFFLVAMQFKEFKEWAVWWILGILYMVMGAVEGIMRIFA